MIDAATLHDLSDVAMGDATITTRAALFQCAQDALMSFVNGGIDADTFIEATEDLINGVTLLDEPERDD